MVGFLWFLRVAASRRAAMIHEALGRPVPVELTSDRRVRGRVLRLAAVSLVALGLVVGLAARDARRPAGDASPPSRSAGS